MAGSRKRKKKGENNFLLYAVSKGLRTGIFKNWLSCAPNVNKVPGCVYKGFNDIEEAKRWLNAEKLDIVFNDCTEEEFKTSNNKVNISSDISLSSSFSSTDPLEGTSTDFLKRKMHANHEMESDSSSLYLMIIQQSEKIARLESMVNEQSIQIASLKSIITSTIKESVQEILTATFQHTSNSENASFSHIVKRQTKYSSGDNSFVQHNSSTGKESNIRLQEKSNPVLKPKTSSERKNRKTTPFKPKQCIVITLRRESKLMEKFNPDVVRRTICSHFGPTIIEDITPYRFNSDNPRIMVQLHSEELASNISSAWPSNLFDGSEARTTINPVDSTKHSVMMKGVPLDYEEDMMNQEITARFPGAKTFRLRTKNGKILRTVKIQFACEEHLDECLKNGITLPSQSLICLCEKLNYNG